MENNQFSGNISPSNGVYRRRASNPAQLKREENVVLKELENAKKDSRIKVPKNILDVNDISNNITIINPCHGNPYDRDVNHGGFITDKAYIKPDSFFFMHDTDVGFLRGGPRKHIAIRPDKVKAVILTCGGLCPGLNVVIRELVMSLWFNYDVRSIHGIQWGYGGINDESAWMELNPLKVKDIHTLGGTILGTSRGGFDGVKIVDTFIKKGINMVFTIGGDGTHRGILALSKEIESRGVKIILSGIPKTIDNDIPIIDRSFGFESSVEQAVKAIQSANIEANSVKNGIGLVKLFGRHCGFIALKASLASRDVNICLIPESGFHLYGEHGLLEFIFQRLEVKSHCVIVVAEGAGSAILDKTIKETGQKDKSGNAVLSDIGNILKEEIKKSSDERGVEVTLKYIDPTYIIRSCPANSFDVNYCA